MASVSATTKKKELLASTAASPASGIPTFDELVTEKQFKREVPLSDPTRWRKTKFDPHFPKLLKIGSRSYRLRSEIEAYKLHLQEEALRKHGATRGKTTTNRAA